jgi:hypothetical protein
MVERKRTNKDIQDMHIKLKDRETQTPIKTGGELGCSGQVSSDTRCVNLVTNAVLSHE